MLYLAGITNLPTTNTPEKYGRAHSKTPPTEGFRLAFLDVAEHSMNPTILMDKKKQIAQVRKFRDELKEYYVLCGPRWKARNGYGSVPKESIEQEKVMREKLTEDWGRLERLFKKIGAPTSSYHPLAGVTRPFFDDALSFDFDGTVKGQGLEAAIQSATKATGLLDALSDVQYKSLLRATPSVFIGHSFKDEHKDSITEIINFVCLK